MTLYYKEETKDVNGLPGYRYWGTNETLPGNGTDGCYCVKGTCAPSGETLAEEEGMTCWGGGDDMVEGVDDTLDMRVT